jgi:hypothetical protein
MRLGQLNVIINIRDSPVKTYRRAYHDITESNVMLLALLSNAVTAILGNSYAGDAAPRTDYHTDSGLREKM